MVDDGKKHTIQFVQKKLFYYFTFVEKSGTGRLQSNSVFPLKAPISHMFHMMWTLFDLES